MCWVNRGFMNKIFVFQCNVINSDFMMWSVDIDFSLVKGVIIFVMVGGVCV